MTQRDDAALVYRHLVSVGSAGSSLVEIAAACFPLPEDRDDPARAQMLKRGIGRAHQSLLWMRGQGVRIEAVPGVGSWADGFTPTRFVVMTSHVT